MGRRVLVSMIIVITAVLSATGFRGMCPYSSGISIENEEVVAEFDEDGKLENLALKRNMYNSVMEMWLAFNRKPFKPEKYRSSDGWISFESGSSKVIYSLEGNVLKVSIEFESKVPVGEVRIFLTPCDVEPVLIRGRDLHFVQGRHVAYGIHYPGSMSIFTAGKFVVIKRGLKAGDDGMVRTSFEIPVNEDVESIRREIVGGEAVSMTVVDGDGRRLEGVKISALVGGKIVSISTSDRNGEVEFVGLPEDVTFDVLGDAYEEEKIENGKIVVSRPEGEGFRWGPYLTGMSTDSVYVSFRLWNPATATASLMGPNIERVMEDGILDTFHTLKLDGLESGRRYELRISAGGYEERITFETLKERGYSFAVYGDTRTNEDWHAMVCSRMAEEDISFVLHTGDLVESGDLMTDWDKFFDASKDLYSKVPIFPTLGNHEHNSPLYYQAFMEPRGGGDFLRRWYSFSLGEVHFVFIDSNVAEGTNLDEQQIEWLENDLKNSDERFKIVVFHHPFFTNSPNREPTYRKKWEELFERYGVSLVFNGHIHHYERFHRNGVVYVTTGGGGAPLGFGLLSSGRKHLPGTEAGVAGYLHYVLVRVEDDGLEATVKSVAKYDWGVLSPVEKILDEFTIPGR